MSKPYDAGSKWLLEHQGKSLALLGGMTGVLACRSLQAEVVHAQKLPDGLLEVRLKGRKQPVLLLVEFCTYPESRNPRQLMDDVLLVAQVRKVLPEVLAVVLRPKGNAVVPASHEVASELGWTRLVAGWKVVEVYNLSAEEMLALPDVGIVPWVPLMHHGGPTAPLLRRCRDRIEKEGGDRKDGLLAVTQLFLTLTGAGSDFLDLFGGREAMIEWPFVKEYGEETARKGQQKFVEEAFVVRFGPLSDDARARLEGVNEEAKLQGLLRFAVVCPSKEAFLERLAVETTPPPAPPSSRRKRKS